MSNLLERGKEVVIKKPENVVEDYKEPEVETLGGWTVKNLSEENLFLEEFLHRQFPDYIYVENPNIPIPLNVGKMLLNTKETIVTYETGVFSYNNYRISLAFSSIKVVVTVNANVLFSEVFRNKFTKEGLKYYAENGYKLFIEPAKTKYIPSVEYQLIIK